MWIKHSIGKQRKALMALFEPAMLNISKRCVLVWSDLEHLDNVLNRHFSSIPYCHLVYAVDKFGQQISSNISAQGIDHSYRKQDLSRRPYSVSLYPKRHFMLSSVYITQTSGRPCISAIHPVIDDSQQFLGFIAADFDIRHLPLPITTSNSSSLPNHWALNHPHQILQQYRITSAFDKFMDEIEGILNKLISEHGVFHVMMHYASAQTLLWQMDKPYEYHLFDIEQLLDPNMYLTYPRRSYPSDAIVTPKQIQPLLKHFRRLRLGNENIYLRSGSLNVMNGSIGLTFSFDGSQYLSAEEFLKRKCSDWFERAENSYSDNKQKKHLFKSTNFKNSFLISKTFATCIVGSG